MKFEYLKIYSQFELSNKLFVRKNTKTNEYVFIFFQDNLFPEALLASDGKRYDFDGKCLSCKDYEIIQESNSYGKLDYLKSIPSIISSEETKLLLSMSLKEKLKEDISTFNQQLRIAIIEGKDELFITLPSVSRVKQLHEFISNGGYNVEAYTGGNAYFIKVQL